MARSALLPIERFSADLVECLASAYHGKRWISKPALLGELMSNRKSIAGKLVRVQAIRIRSTTLELRRQEQALLESRHTFETRKLGRDRLATGTLRLLHRAVVVARKTGACYVGTEHVLLAALDERRSILSAALARSGCDTESLRQLWTSVFDFRGAP